MNRRPGIALALFAPLLLVGCASPGGDTGSPGGDENADVNWDCDPLVPDHCGMPFPSTYFMVEDPSTATGWRVNLGPTTLPGDIDGYQPDPRYWNERDGWSVAGMAVALLPGVSLAGTIPQTDIGAYADDDALTLIVDADTGERVPHWVELDQRSPDPDRAALILRPAVPYDYGHHYVVGLRGLVDEAGDPLAPSEGMAALVAGESTGDPRVDERQERYDTVIFPALEAQGWNRDEVLLAWDFVTASREDVSRRLLWMRDDALDRIGEDGPPYTITEIEEDYSDAFVRVVHGTMTVPLYTESDRPPTLLTRDEDGMPYYNGDTEVPFSVAIPRSLVDDPHPTATVQYGHGFFGEQSEVYATWADWNEQLAIDRGWIFYGVDWTGMKEEDAGAVALLVATDMEEFPALPERTQQGFIEALCVERLVNGALQSDPALMLDDPETGEPVDIVDEDRRYFYGVSQGGILGGAYLAIQPDIERAVFGVSGAPYTLLTSRSKHFDDFFMLFEAKYDDPADILYWQAAMQTPWDAGEAAGYLRSLTSDPLDGATEKRVLIQNAIGDAQVSTLGGHVMARAYGARFVGEPAREVFGIEQVDPGEDGWAGSALVEWDYGVTEPTDATPPDTETDTHGYPRREELAQLQLATFLEDGVVIDPCDGPCDEGDSHILDD